MPLAYIAWDASFGSPNGTAPRNKYSDGSAGEAKGQQGYLLVPPEVQPKLNAVWAKLLEGDKTSYSLNDNIAKDGRRLLCEWFNTAVRDDSGQVTDVLSMVHDMTHNKTGSGSAPTVKNNSARCGRSLATACG